MTINEYQKLAMTTPNPKLNKKEILINGVMGLCGESGEAIDKEVGTGATVGKIHGADGCMKSGIGSYAVQIGELSCLCKKCINF